MAFQVKIMLINYTTAAQVCDVTFSGTPLKPKRCNPHEPEDDIEAKPVQPTTYSLKVPAGGICGFFADSGVSVANPDAQNIHLISANGKNPWPPPPPRPSAFDNQDDYVARYTTFLASGAVGKGGVLATFVAIDPDASFVVSAATLTTAATTTTTTNITTITTTTTDSADAPMGDDGCEE